MSTTPSPAPPPIRRLSAVWFADIVGFTSITSVNETLGLRHVELLQRIARRETEESYKGRIVKFIGDAALAEFGSADAAVRAAIAVSTFYTQEAHELGRNSTLRIGVHLGEVILADDGDIYGDGVNVASRLQSEAEPGRVLISEDVWRQLRQRPEFMFHSLGERELKGIATRMGVFDVLLRGSEYSADALHPRAVLEQNRFRNPSNFKAAGVAAGAGAALLAMFFLWPKPTHEEAVTLAQWTSAGGGDVARVETFTRGLTQELQIANRAAGLSSPKSDQPARYVLEGSVWGFEDSTRVIVQLIDSKEEQNLWAGVYERRITDRFVHRDLAREINTAIAGVLNKDVLPKPAAAEKKPDTAAAAKPRKEPAISPREAATASARRVVDTFARSLANRTARDQYPFGSAVMKEIRTFAGGESNITDVNVGGFKVRDYQPDRVEADLLLIIRQRSGTEIESLPLPFRAVVTRTGTSWHLTAFQRR
jgi:class 3 adenylate cyclase